MTVEKDSMGFAENISNQKNHADRLLVAVPHPQTLSFLKESLQNQSFSQLDEKGKKLISLYFLNWGIRLGDLTNIADVNSPRDVWKIIKQDMESLWNELSPGLKETYPIEDVVKIKQVSYSPQNQRQMQAIPRDRGHTGETRRKISRSKKGIARSKETREAISKGVKKLWEKPGQREKISLSMKIAKKAQKNEQILWKETMEEDLIRNILSAGLLTQDEINQVKLYYDGGKKPSEALLDKFSIAVARTA